MFRSFQLIHQSNRVVFERNPAVALFVGNELVRTQAEFAGSLARNEESGRTEVGSVDVGLL
jgi:hypothetical protein